MPADKQTVLILTFLVVFGVSAAITITGALPKIFETNEKVNQAVVQQHEDEGRANQTIIISQHMDEKIDAVQDNLTTFIKESEQRSNVSNQQRINIMGNISQVLDSLQNKTREHALFSQNMNDIQKDVGNLTKEIRDMLEDYGENSIKKFDKIVDTQKRILTEHEQLLVEINKTLMH